MKPAWPAGGFASRAAGLHVAVSRGRSWLSGNLPIETTAVERRNDFNSKRARRAQTGLATAGLIRSFPANQERPVRRFSRASPRKHSRTAQRRSGGVTPRRFDDRWRLAGKGSSLLARPLSALDGGILRIASGHSSWRSLTIAGRSGESLARSPTHDVIEPFAEPNECRQKHGSTRSHLERASSRNVRPVFA